MMREIAIGVVALMIATAASTLTASALPGARPLGIAQSADLWLLRLATAIPIRRIDQAQLRRAICPRDFTPTGLIRNQAFSGTELG
jgi:hypothetical protein